MTAFSQACQGVIVIDGKVLRRSFDRASGKSAPQMVSACGREQEVVLGQIATDAKSNEITAVPKLLKMLSLKGTIVTVDALNCQRAIAGQIVEKDGNYALALKANQPGLSASVAGDFLKCNYPGHELPQPLSWRLKAKNQNYGSFWEARLISLF